MDRGEWSASRFDRISLEEKALDRYWIGEWAGTKELWE
jgi:hypothetical protein